MLRFVTGNAGKVEEARAYLGGDVVEQFEYDYVEVQSSDLVEIAATGARDAHEAVGGDPVIVDDTGLFVDAFDGFPGPFSAYVEDTLGVERVWELASSESNRRAAFRSVVAYCDGAPIDPHPGRVDGDPPVVVFEGVVRGRLVAPRGDQGFGYDPIFEHDGETFAELAVERKNAISHRGRALAAFAEWYADR